jgi:hypothetical protein
MSKNLKVQRWMSSEELARLALGNLQLEINYRNCCVWELIQSLTDGDIAVDMSYHRIPFVSSLQRFSGSAKL